MTRSRITADLVRVAECCEILDQVLQRQRKRDRHHCSDASYSLEQVAVVCSGRLRVLVETAQDDLVSISQVSISQGNG